MSITPLTILPFVENADSSRSKARRAIQWLGKYIPFKMHHEIPRGRRSVEHQLNLRKSFYEDQWREIGIPLDFAKTVLEVIYKEMAHPNGNYLPDDPLSLVLIPDYDDFPLASVRHGIRKTVGVDIPYQELSEMFVSMSWTPEIGQG